MKMIIKNDYNLKDEQITETVKRVKILLVNSNNEVLLGYSHNTYQFPGGHVEDGETLYETVIREIKEETGITLNLDESIKPFACRIAYYKDHPKEGNNRKIEIYYFEIITDEKYNLNETNYTKNELDGNFILKYIPLDKVEEVLNENIVNYKDEYGISKEMLELFNIYKNKA